MDHGGFDNPLEYSFTDWGWLGNMWLKQNNWELPSWRQVQQCIMNEQQIFLKEENGQKMKEQFSQELKK